MKANVYSKSGKKTEKQVELQDDIFCIQPNDHEIYLDCKQYLANNRQGSHKTKGRSEVKGSTRKIKKQKGTGTARAGDIKNPIFRGGGRTFGPQPRNYGFKLNKKIKKLARKSALSYKSQNDGICIVDNLNFEGVKTKNVIDFLNNLKLIDKKSLLIVANQNKSLYLSSRNLKQTEVVIARELNAYGIMRASVLIIEEDAIDVFKECLD